MNQTILLSFCFFFVLTPLSAQAPDLEDLNTEAYLSMMDADNLMKEEKPDEALPLYQQALEAYQKINGRDPGFNSGIMEHRIEVLTKKINSLEKKLPAQAEPPPAVEEPSEPPLEDDYETLYLETREKMLRDAARLLELEKRNIEMVVTRRENQQTLTQQEARIRDLQNQLADTEEKQQRATANLRKEIQDLNRFNTLLQERADQLETSTAELTAERDGLRNTVTERNLQLSELDDELRETKRELAAVKLNSTQSEQRLILARNQLRDDLKAAERELETARKAEAETAEKVAGLALLEETVIELNKRNEQQAVQLQEKTEQISALREQVELGTGDMERVQNELEKSRKERETAVEKFTEIREEVKSTREVTRNLRRAESQLADAEKEIAKLRLNFQQEQDVRTQLQTTVEQQLITITERMNEIIGLRREIAQLKEQTAVSLPEAEDSSSETESEAETE